MILQYGKFWFDFVLGVNHQFITLLQYVISYTLILNFKRNLCFLDTILVIFFAYLTLKSVSQIFFITFLSDLAINHFNTLFSVMKWQAMLILMYFFSKEEFISKNLRVVSFLITLGALYSLVFSLLQMPFSPFADIFKNYGGNITSQNHLGFFRANGGLSGTVISYANYLWILLIYSLFYNFKNKKTRTLLFFVLACSSVLCFSRSVFVTFLMLVLGYTLTTRYYYLVFVFVGISFINIEYFIGLDEVIRQYFVMISDSDVKRVDGWNSIVNDLKGIYWITGVTIGGNAGVFTDGAGVIRGDGFIQELIFELGIVGFLLFEISIYAYLKLLRDYRCQILVFITLNIMLLVNSGFNKFFIFFMFFLVISLIGSNNARKTVKRVNTGVW